MKPDGLSRDYRRWLALANEELEAARCLLEDPKSSPRFSSFWAQEAATKAIMAGLVKHQIEFPLRHDLDYLTSLLPDNWNPKQRFPDLATLTRWGPEIHYPDAEEVPTVDDAKSAVSLAARIVESIERDIQDENE